MGCAEPPLHPVSLRSQSHLQGSRLTTRQGELRVQDAYSLRCIPQVHGASWQARTFTFKVDVPEDAETYHPYEEPVIQALVTFRSGSVETVKKDGLNGPSAALHDVGLTMSPEDIVVNTGDRS